MLKVRPTCKATDLITYCPGCNPCKILYIGSLLLSLLILNIKEAIEKQKHSFFSSNITVSLPVNSDVRSNSANLGCPSISMNIVGVPYIEVHLTTKQLSQANKNKPKTGNCHANVFKNHAYYIFL